MSQWRLICNKTGEVVKAGDKRETFRGETVTVGEFAPPHKPESTGKVQLIEGDDRSLFYYPGVINCHYEQAIDTSEIAEAGEDWFKRAKVRKPH